MKLNFVTIVAKSNLLFIIISRLLLIIYLISLFKDAFGPASLGLGFLIIPLMGALTIFLSLYILEILMSLIALNKKILAMYGLIILLFSDSILLVLTETFEDSNNAFNYFNLLIILNVIIMIALLLNRKFFSAKT